MFIVADIGASKTRIARVRDYTSFDTPVVYDTPYAYSKALERMVATSRSLAKGEAVAMFFAGVPGVLSKGKQALFDAPHLPDWNHKPLARDLSAALGAQIILENDAALVGLGEATAGAGKGSRILAYVTVSTGVNGVRIVDGAIDRAAYGFEIGDQLFDMDGEWRTLESLVSGTAIKKRFGMPPRELGKDAPVWEELAQVLAYALHNTIVHWSPDTIVLGGSMFNEIGIPIPSIEHYLKPLLSRFPEMPRLAHAQLGDYGGLSGALARLRS